jgi:DNA-binding response OmpR family regulator
MTHFRERQSFLNNTQSAINFIHRNSDEIKVAGMNEHPSIDYYSIKVLIVEDNEINIKVIKLFSTFDLVILDIGLPDINGIELCKQIRKVAVMQYIPIVAWTAFEGDLRSECMKAGMNDYITKPITIKDLKEMLLRNLKVRNGH